MNDLLFTALILALLYYFFYYLPEQKQLKTQTISTQTDSFTNPELLELQSKNQSLTTELKTKSKEIKTKDTQITQLQSEIRELVKRPLKPTNSKHTQTNEE